MNNRLRVTFKDTERTDLLVDFIEERFERLRKVAPNIIRCTVVVSSPHRSHRHGNASEVSIDLRVPGREFIGRARSNPDQGSDLFTAISDGFHSLNKQLIARRRTSSPPPRPELAPIVSVPAPQSHGQISA